MNWQWLITIGLWLYGISLIALTLRILMKRRPVGVSLAWLLFLYIIPVGGIVAYLLFGERYLGRLRARRATEQFNYYSLWLQRILLEQQHVSPARPVLRPVMELTRGSLGMPVIVGSRWSLHSDPQDVFKRLIDDIDNANETILMEFYILEAEGAVLPVLDALEQAVSRGIQVYLMVDSVGSNRFLRSKRSRQLTEAGVKVVDALHANLLRMTLRRQDLRQHRKLIAIDNQIAYTGSMNLADPAHFKTSSGVGPWVDIMVRLEGDIAKVIQGTLIFDWEMETGIRLEKHLDWPEFKPVKDDNLMQLLPSGPALDEEILLQVLLTVIHNARSSITITTPYFVPDEALLQALKSAAKRGLEVTVILPAKNDSRLAEYAGRSFYYELLQAGVHLLQFNGGLLHTKTVVIDRHMVLIGSVNLDMRSIWLNFESTLIVDDDDFCEAVLAQIDVYQNESHCLLSYEWQKRPHHQRLLENLAQLASPLL
ncbi:cardiolipin synthase [Reinekea blandensis]|uniref:Cardiolipin synthase n=1 Tax=Reinekea blandensis MED297 TaxID=314283 RepID=A4BKA8_9GAMM|nr:cardiolipin synthase [Reinekea blandensis]EAR07413.1 cardiolipin synthetase [Reinekea sp. MED297] [Reinekea blandensis MED297]